MPESCYHTCISDCPFLSSLYSGIFAYVILKENVDTDHNTLRQEMSNMVAARIGKFAKPESIIVSFCDFLEIS